MDVLENVLRVPAGVFVSEDVDSTPSMTNGLQSNLLLQNSLSDLPISTESCMPTEKDYAFLQQQAIVLGAQAALVDGVNFCQTSRSTGNEGRTDINSILEGFCLPTEDELKTLSGLRIDDTDDNAAVQGYSLTGAVPEQTVQVSANMSHDPQQFSKSSFLGSASMSTPLVPILKSTPLQPEVLLMKRPVPRKRRARILKDGQLTMIVYGQNEALLWAKRVAVFQQAMRQVLGDRRKAFTWSGSVIDSVVGAFLTQNVSDFLSSKAFMELASRFPVTDAQSSQAPREPAQGDAASARADPMQGEDLDSNSALNACTAPFADKENVLCGMDCQDSVDWEAVRTAPSDLLSDAIKCRGMQFFLAKRIQGFLNSVVEHNKSRLAQERAMQRGPRPQQEGLPEDMTAPQKLLGEGQVEEQQGLHNAQQAQQEEPSQERQVSVEDMGMMSPGRDPGVFGSGDEFVADPEHKHTLLSSQEVAPHPLHHPSGPHCSPSHQGSECVECISPLSPRQQGRHGLGNAPWGGHEEMAQHAGPHTGSGAPRGGSVSRQGPAVETPEKKAPLPQLSLQTPSAGPSGGEPARGMGDAGIDSGVDGEGGGEEGRGLGRRKRQRRAGTPVKLQYEESVERGRGDAVEDAAAVADPQEDQGQVLLGAEQDGDSKQEGLLSLEWLREAGDQEARDFLMSVEGLGRKSVACIMLLTLGRKEFPVDTNVGRICARLGWIPLDSEQAVEDLDDYAPEPEVHKYLHSRLMGFGTEALYELHYQMITLGKVFCSKANPNCQACPMQADCEYSLNNGPSLHGRKRARRQELPPALAPSAQQAQQQHVADPTAWEGGWGTGGPTFARPVAVRPGDVDLDVVLGVVPRRQRSGGHHGQAAPQPVPHSTAPHGAASDAGGGPADQVPRAAPYGTPILEGDIQGPGPAEPAEPAEYGQQEWGLRAGGSGEERAAGEAPAAALDSAAELGEEVRRTCRVAKAAGGVGITRTLRSRVVTGGDGGAAVGRPTRPGMRGKRGVQELSHALVTPHARPTGAPGTAGTAPGDPPPRMTLRSRRVQRGEQTNPPDTPSSHEQSLVAGEAQQEAAAAAGLEVQPSREGAGVRRSGRLSEVSQHGNAAGAAGLPGDADSQDSQQPPADAKQESDAQPQAQGRIAGMPVIPPPAAGAEPGAQSSGRRPPITRSGRAVRLPRGAEQYIGYPALGLAATAAAGDEQRMAELDGGEGSASDREAGDGEEGEGRYALQRPRYGSTKYLGWLTATACALARPRSAWPLQQAAPAASGGNVPATTLEGVAHNPPSGVTLEPMDVDQREEGGGGERGNEQGGQREAPLGCVGKEGVGRADGTCPTGRSRWGASGLLAAAARVLTAAATPAVALFGGRQRPRAEYATGAGSGAVGGGDAGEGGVQRDALPVDPSRSDQEKVQEGEPGECTGPAGPGRTWVAGAPEVAAAGQPSGTPPPFSQGDHVAVEEWEGVLEVEEQLAAVQRAVLLAEGTPSLVALHQQRSLELALQLLGVQATLHVGTSRSVLSAARRQYHHLSMKTHPDKSSHPRAPLAFAAVSHAFGIVSRAVAAATGSDTWTAGDGGSAAEGTFPPTAAGAPNVPDGAGGDPPHGAAPGAACALGVGLPQTPAEESGEEKPPRTLIPLGGAAAAEDALTPPLPAGSPTEEGASSPPGPLSTPLKPLSIGEQLTWTPQRRVVKGYLLPPHLAPRLPPLSGITARSMAGGAGPGVGDPLLFVPLGSVCRGATMPPPDNGSAVDEGPKAGGAGVDPGGGGSAGPKGKGGEEVEGERDPQAEEEPPVLEKQAMGGVLWGGSASAAAASPPVLGAAEPHPSPPPTQPHPTLHPDTSHATSVAPEAGMSAENPAPQADPPSLPMATGTPPKAVPSSAEGTFTMGQLPPAQPPLVPDGGRPSGTSSQSRDSRGVSDGEGLGEGVKGVILVTCKAAMKGRFPLNGTYFQVNEVFVDHGTVDAPFKVPEEVLGSCACCAVHFGQGIHYMTKGMSQQQVANMFAHGYVCFRAFDPHSGAPMPLPPFLAPSVPKTTPSKWRPKAALRAAQRAAARATQGPPGGSQLLWDPQDRPQIWELSTAQEGPFPPLQHPYRLVAAPGASGVDPAPPPAVGAWVPAQQTQQGSDAAGSGAAVEGAPGDTSWEVRRAGWGSSLTVAPPSKPGQSQGWWQGMEPFTPPPPPKKRRGRWGAQPGAGGGKGDGEGGRGAREDVDAATRKSGKGRSRMNEFKAIRSSQRCGECATCLNRHWKKACLTRRQEMVADAPGITPNPDAPPPPGPNPTRRFDPLKLFSP